MINIFDCIIYDYSEIVADSDDVVSQIVSHTANTWQVDRGIDEKTGDTKLGKLAEKAVKLFFDQYLTSVKHISYDEIRTDNGEKDAPFDALLYDTFQVDNNTVRTFIERINAEISQGNKYGHISTNLRKDLYCNGIFTLEVKSTRINEKKRAEANFSSYDEAIQIKSLIAALCNDDFLTYPLLKRIGEYNWFSYCLYAKTKVSKFSSLTGPSLSDAVKELELVNMDDFYIRVYMDEIHKKAVVLGYITKENLMNPPYIKKMRQKNKSEKALYLAKPLTARKPLEDLISLLED